MHVVERVEGRAGGAIGVRVWRELGQLALEGLVIGLAFSVLLAAAVYMVARERVTSRTSRRRRALQRRWRRSRCRVSTGLARICRPGRTNSTGHVLATLRA